MNERMQVWVGTALLILSAVVILVFALPESAVAIAVPVPVAALAALVMAAGTLLVGTSDGTV